MKHKEKYTKDTRLLFTDGQTGQSSYGIVRDVGDTIRVEWDYSHSHHYTRSWLDQHCMIIEPDRGYPSALWEGFKFGVVNYWPKLILLAIVLVVLFRDRG